MAEETKKTEGADGKEPTFADAMAELTAGMAEQKKHVKFNDEIEFPLEVKSVHIGQRGLGNCDKDKIGMPVRIKSCAPEDGDGTHLGFYLGDMFTGSAYTAFDDRDSSFNVGMNTNPAIFVPDFGKVVWGCGSFWGFVESEDDLRQITKESINDLWYIRAIKALGGENGDDLTVGELMVGAIMSTEVEFDADEKITHIYFSAVIGRRNDELNTCGLDYYHETGEYRWPPEGSLFQSMLEFLITHGLHDLGGDNANPA